ncbi:MAG: MerR family transcriptional regulator [Oscillospiraceae bacterium]|jgi:flagellar operon protein (TIGR03826 family)|nr:MerR family transcriptional regulator [Oscillospiraceae bacterium]
MDIRQCKRCKKLFAYTARAICPECIRELDEQFKYVRDYLYDHPNATMEKVCEETGAEMADIHRWLREGRLIQSTVTAPMLTCKVCGAPIYTGEMCDKCTNNVRAQFKKTAEALKPPPEPFQTKREGRMHVDVRKK